MKPLPDGPVVRRVRLELPHPTAADHAADLDRVLRGLEDHGWTGVQAPLNVVAGLPKTLRAGNFTVVATVAFVPVPTLLRVEPASAPSRNLGLAVDLGSTNIVGALIDLETGETLGERSALNPQVEHGEDILARTHLCLHKGGLERLQALAAAAIGDIAAQLAPAAGIAVEDICCVCVAGNTTMAHFLLGLDPYHLCRAPYVPVANRFPVVRAAELGLGVNPAAPVIVLPNVGSYVGGDALAGVLVSGMHTRERVSLLVDIGTNAEIVVGNREFLLVGAGSAGPGLEGGVVRHGMRAAPGAIERIAIDPRTLLPSFDVIGGGAPRGICGSGLIDLMAELFTTGIVDGRGKFVLPSPSPRVVVREGAPCFVVAEAAADRRRGGDPLHAGRHGQPDAEQGGDVHDAHRDDRGGGGLLRRAGAVLHRRRVRRVRRRRQGRDDRDGARHPAGEIPAARQLLARGGEAGAALGRARWRRSSRSGGRMTYVEMNESREFMNGFMAARFLPHTDLDLFPSVRERRKQPEEGGDDGQERTDDHEVGAGDLSLVQLREIRESALLRRLAPGNTPHAGRVRDRGEADGRAVRLPAHEEAAVLRRIPRAGRLTAHPVVDVFPPAAGSGLTTTRPVEQKFQVEHSAGRYAQEMGVPLRRLNATARLFAGVAVPAAIDRRLILEAKRQLLFSDRSVGEISFALGFDEHSYCTRVFRKRLGMTPTEFRASIVRRSAAGVAASGKANGFSPNVFHGAGL